jgi:hypothetical protein
MSDNRADRSPGSSRVGLVRAAVGGFLRTLGQPLGATLQFARDDVPDLPGAGTGIEYWRDGLERRMPRGWELRWRGRVLVRMRSRHNERAYWRRRRDLTRLIDEMNWAGVLPPLGGHSRVLEPGCNLAQNLWEISRRWHCEIHGLDMKRIGKAGPILEPTAPDKTGRVDWAQQGTYCLSWDDWARWYDLTPFVPKAAIPNTDVFYCPMVGELTSPTTPPRGRRTAPAGPSTAPARPSS